MSNKLKKKIFLFTKGLAMGAADIVPGVSGGTIAFITGIYQELLDSIKAININAFNLLFKKGFNTFWTHINGTFLLVLVSGIMVSVLSLAKLITYLLENYPVLLWSFFFGLIVASAIYIGKLIKKWSVGNIIALVIGGSLSYYITIATPMNGPDTYWYIFISGFVAICAMILPGISGSFILLLLGSYSIVLATITGLLSALKDFNFDLIIHYSIKVTLFIIGCMIGLLTFSRFISYMFQKYYALTLALLTGFMLGSLNKVWPWKETLEWRVNSHGNEVPFLQASISPITYENMYAVSSQTVEAIVLALIGILVVFGFQRLGKVI